MARRKISMSDLLQEEVQKMPNSQDLNVSETIDVEVKEKETEAAQASQEEPEIVAKSEFESTVNALKAELVQVQDHERALQKQIDGLLRDLQTQESLVQTLQTQAELANSLKAELDETKQTALKLAEANSQLLEEVERLKNQQAEKQLSKPKSAQKYPDPSPNPAPLQRYGMRGRVEKVTYDEPVWQIDESATTTWLD